MNSNIDKLKRLLINTEEARGFQESPDWLQNFFIVLVIVSFGLSIALRLAPLAWLILIIGLVAIFKLIAKSYK